MIPLWPSSRTTGLAFFWGGDGLAYGHEADVCVYAPGRMTKPVAYHGHADTVLSYRIRQMRNPLQLGEGYHDAITGC